MGDRIDEMKGKVKETVGDVTDNERMEREGQAEQDVAKTRRELKGVSDQVGGKVKETVGKATGDEDTELEGKLQQQKGDLERVG